jgi:hypothetical protein
MERRKLPEIPSEFIEPYLTKFMGNIIEFASTACTEEELKERNGVGWTIAELKQWIKGVEMFVSWTCGIHARLAMSNEFYNRWKYMPDDEIKRICKKVMDKIYSDPTF